MSKAKVKPWKRKVPKMCRTNKKRKFSGKGGASTSHHKG